MGIGHCFSPKPGLSLTYTTYEEVITIKSVEQLSNSLEEWFKKLPPLPANAVDGLVSIAPWIALIFGVLGILGGISSFGVLTMFTPFAMMGGVSGYGLGFIAALIWLVSSVLMLMAYPGLKAKKKSGWDLFFLSEIVSVLATVLSFSLGGLLGVIIGFYLLFQIKPKYH